MSHVQRQTYLTHCPIPRRISVDILPSSECNVRKFSANKTFRVGGTFFMSKFALVVALLCTCLDIAAFGQSSNANLSGTVSDAGKAFIPGVTVTATNTETGVVTTAVSNEAGTYTIPSLLPGTYKVSAELPGFQTQTFTNVKF